MLRRTGTGHLCQFTLSPTQKAPVLIHPVLRIDNWADASAQVSLDGHRLTNGSDYRAAIPDGALLLFLNRVIERPAELVVDGR